MALTSLPQSTCLQGRDLTTEVQFELASGLKAAFTGFGHLFEGCRRHQEPAEGRLRRLKRDLVGQAALMSAPRSRYFVRLQATWPKWRQQ